MTIPRGSLAKGGGAIQVIDENFSPDLYTGTGNFAVPIIRPTGRGGFQPTLTLVFVKRTTCTYNVGAPGGLSR